MSDQPANAVDLFFEAWDELGKPFSKIHHTKNRDNAIRLRLADKWWAENYADALEHMKKSPHCRGKNDRGWIGNITFFLRPDVVARLVEGEFDDKRGGVPEREPTPEEERADGLRRAKIQRQHEEQFAREHHDRGEKCSYAWCEKCRGKKGD